MIKKVSILILLVVAGIAFLFPAAAEEEYGKDMKVTIMPHSHIDTAWYWTQSSTVTFSFSTFYNALNMIKDNPDYYFNSSNAKHLIYIRDYFPDLFEEIREAVAEGRWDYDSGWVESDLLLISAESLARCYMYAQRFFKEEFGEYSRVICLPDNFGMGWNLPQFMKKLGYDFFVSTRVSAIPGREGTAGGVMGNDLFLWRGVEDTEVLFYKPSPWYAAEAPLQDVLDVAETLDEMGLQKGMYLSGRGDAGGGMNQYMIDDAREANETEGYPSVDFGTMSAYYDSLTDEDLSHIAIRYDDELYFVTTHGCYTTQAMTKYYNRKGELALARTEALCAMADNMELLPYPAEQLMDAWDKTLTNQAHGILTGEGTTPVYDDAWNDGAIALNETKAAQDGAFRALALQMDTSAQEGFPIVVYNPVSQERHDVAQATITLDGQYASVRVVDAEGTDYPCQIIKRDGNTAEILFMTGDMPSMGLKTYYAIPAETEPVYETGLTVSESVLENNNLRIEINPLTGNVCSLIDKQTGLELIETGAEVELVLMEDNSRTAWNVDYGDLSLSPLGIVQDSPVITVKEQGPVRCVLNVEREKATNRADGVSTYSQQIILYADGERVDFDNTVDWKEHDVMLKVQVPMNLSANSATFDLSNGTIQRITFNTKRWEVYGHMWADMTDDSGDYGLTVMNDYKYAWDKYSDTTLRLTLLRSARDQDSKADVGVHEFTYSLYPHAGDWRKENSPLEAQLLNNPLIAEQTGRHAGVLGSEYSFIKADQPNVLITALKLSENDIDNYDLQNQNELIVRVNELFGADETQVTLTFPSEIEEAWQCNMLEEKEARLTPDGCRLTITQTDYEYKTIAVKLKSADHAYEQLPEMVAVDLNAYFNMRAFTFNGENADAGLDYYGNTLPAENMDASFMVGEVPFIIGNVADKGVANVVDARGQEISIPQGDYNMLYLVACAAGYNERALTDFTVVYEDGAEETTSLLIEDWNAYYGWRNGEYCAPVARTFYHFHKEGADAQERRANIFLYEIPLNGDAKSLRLPDNDAVKVFALTLEAK